MAVVSITFEHWNNFVLNENNLFQFESISHDNAFVSYHPFEFTQRTLLAHFRMNNTNPPHSQFIQKPVYSAMGLMSHLGSWASQMFYIKSEKCDLQLLKTSSSSMNSTENLWYFNWLIWKTLVSNKNFHLNCSCEMTFEFKPLITLSKSQIKNISWAYIIEVLDQSNTNPAKVWHQFGRPAYPNATVRSAMRKHQMPRIFSTGPTKDGIIYFDLNPIQIPWLISIRMCGWRYIMVNVSKPLKVLVSSITYNEVLVTWQESMSANEEFNHISCLKTYEVWFRINATIEWILISDTYTPFCSYHYAPTKSNTVEGKVISLSLQFY